ncbi:MAG: SMC family ATPase [Oscillospiraceae bacterium]|nr:SMC family ATPase [Oscillospiraceae bacterium]
MRPLKLEISAFCSYSGKTVIDMEKLGENGIYLITGDTGAGKTTIFDAITYALYGSPSGSNRDSSMLRSMYAPVHISTYVKLTFSHNGRTYIIERNPTHIRAKKEGGKPATLYANAEMYEISDGEEKSIASGVTKVSDKVVDILGIDHKQFCHIAMIAQGDFIKLLTAKSDERQKIFRKLFDT